MSDSQWNERNFKISMEDVKKAQRAVSEVIHKTPLEHSRSASEAAGTQIYLKFENQQLTGSFKIRGAMNKILSLTPEQRKRGVVASSAGNHAQGVAFSATHAGIKSHIVMPVTAPLIKVQATKSYGAEVIQKGDYYDQSYEYARELEKEKGYVFVHPFEDPAVIAGQGTLGLEIFEQVSDLESIIVPIGGGGLISGIGSVLKMLNPKIRVYGVQSQANPSMAESFKHKKTIRVDAKMSTIADGIAVKNPSQLMYDHYISQVVDDVAVISEDEIAEAIVFLLERAKTVVEGSSGVALAGAFSGKFNLGKKCCVLLCGGNIDLNIISRVIDRGLRKHGRLANIAVAVEDKPGMLGQIATAIAQKRANILQVVHERGSEGLFLGETAIEFTLETSSWQHLEEIKAALVQIGCRPLKT